MEYAWREPHMVPLAAGALAASLAFMPTRGASNNTGHSPAGEGRLRRVQSEDDFGRMVQDLRLNWVLHDQRIQVHPGVLSFLAKHATLERELLDLRLYRLR